MRIVINGVGVAGPTLAFWLNEAGHDVLLVEEAPQLRTAGYIVDFWGVGYDIAERMGVIDAIRAIGYQVREVRHLGDDLPRPRGKGRDELRRFRRPNRGERKRGACPVRSRGRA